MKLIAGLLLGLLLMVGVAEARTWVRGYYRDSGRYVESYQRSTPSERFDVNGNYKHRWGW